MMIGPGETVECPECRAPYVCCTCGTDEVQRLNMLLREAREYGERMRKSWNQAIVEIGRKEQARQRLAQQYDDLQESVDRMCEALSKHDDCPDCRDLLAQQDDDPGCTVCGGDAITECDDPIQCTDTQCNGFCPCMACGGSGRSEDQVVW